MVKLSNWKKNTFLTASFFMVPEIAFANPMEWANGNWGLPAEKSLTEHYKHLNCEFAPNAIRTNVANNTFRIVSSKGFESDANILKKDEISLTIKYNDETRLMSDGELHVWTMQFLSPNSFAWVRKDWIKDGQILGATAIRVRCEVAEVS